MPEQRADRKGCVLRQLAFEAASAAIRPRSASYVGPPGQSQPLVDDKEGKGAPAQVRLAAGAKQIAPRMHPSHEAEGYDSAVEVFTKRSSSPLNAPPPRRPSPPSEAQLRGKRNSSMSNPQARGSGRPARIARNKVPLQGEINLQPTPPLSRSNHDDEGEESSVSVDCGEHSRRRKKATRINGNDDGSDGSASPTPSQASDEVPYSPSRDPDHTVWAGPAKVKGAKKQKQKEERPVKRSKSRTPVTTKRKGALLDEPSSKKQRSANRRAGSASVTLSGNTTPRKGRSSRLSVPSGLPSARKAGASPSTVKMTSEESNDTKDAKEVSGRSASAAFNNRSREAGTRPNKRRREERESSPEIPVVASNNSKRLREESRRHQSSKSRSRKRDKDEDVERDERKRQRREERRRRRAEAAAEAEAEGDLEGTGQRDDDDAINVRAELYDSEAQELAHDEEEREERRRERERRDELGKEPSERRKKHLIQSWTASVVLAGSNPSLGSSAAPPVARPLSASNAVLDSASPTQDVKLTSIALPPRVLARFHSLGIESTSDLTSRGVHKGDYAALLRHLMTLPEREVTASSEQNFDEVEAWLAERRMMAL